MPSVTIKRTIGGSPETAVAMTNSTWARPLALPANWNKIRLGVRLHWTDAGANLTGGAVFAMGFCSGTTNLYGDATTTHFLGMLLDASTWARTGNPNQYSIGNPGSYHGVVRLGTSNTLSADMMGGGAPSYMPGSANNATADRGIIFLDIIKGSPNYTLQMPFVNLGVAQTDISSTNFLNYMGQAAPTPPSYGGIFPSWCHAVTLAVDEAANGTLNAVNFYWNRSDAAVELCDVAVAVLA